MAIQNFGCYVTTQDDILGETDRCLPKVEFLSDGDPRGDAGGLSREYVLRIPSVS